MDLFPEFTQPQKQEEIVYVMAVIVYNHKFHRISQLCPWLVYLKITAV